MVSSVSVCLRFRNAVFALCRCRYFRSHRSFDGHGQWWNIIREWHKITWNRGLGDSWTIQILRIAHCAVSNDNLFNVFFFQFPYRYRKEFEFQHGAGSYAKFKKPKTRQFQKVIIYLRFWRNSPWETINVRKRNAHIYRFFHSFFGSLLCS